MIGAIMISFSGVYVKWAHVGPTVSGFYRVFIGGGLLAIIAGIRGERWWVDAPYFGLQLLCGLIFALDLFFWHKSILFIGPGLATILANFQVFVLALIGVAVLGERINLKLALTIPLSVLGLFLVVGGGWHSLAREFRWGIVCGLTTALCYTGYILSLRKLQTMEKRLPPFSNLAVVSLAAAVALGLISLGQGEGFGVSDAATVVALVAYALFSQVVGWVLISNGLPGVRASLAGLLLLLQPSLAFIWDMLFFGMEITYGNVIGTVITLSAIYLGSTARSK